MTQFPGCWQGGVQASPSLMVTLLSPFVFLLPGRIVFYHSIHMLVFLLSFFLPSPLLFLHHSMERHFSTLTPLTFLSFKHSLLFSLDTLSLFLGHFAKHTFAFFPLSFPSSLPPSHSPSFFSFTPSLHSFLPSPSKEKVKLNQFSPHHASAALEGFPVHALLLHSCPTRYSKRCVFSPTRGGGEAD